MPPERNVAHVSIDTGAGRIPQFTIHDRLRKARESAGMNQGELADKMGVDRSTVSNNEVGRVAPRKIVLRAWATVTGVSLDWIISGRPESPGPDGGVGPVGLEPTTYGLGLLGLQRLPAAA